MKIAGDREACATITASGFRADAPPAVRRPFGATASELIDQGDSIQTQSRRGRAIILSSKNRDTNPWR
jgi:hypothetical protein